jgi:hypothetical protein
MATLAASALALLVVSCPGGEMQRHDKTAAGWSPDLRALRSSAEHVLRAQIVSRVRRPALLSSSARVVRRRARASVALTSPAAWVEHAGEWPAPSEDELFGLEAEARAASGARLHPERALVALAKETWVFAGPSSASRKLGYLRAGAVVERSIEAVRGRDCDGAWYRVAPEGFVCAGSAATLDVDHPLVGATSRRADRNAKLPYAYGMSLFPTPPFYAKVPSRAEQDRAEPGSAARRGRAATRWQDAPVEPVPELLRVSAPGSDPTALLRGRAMVKSGFAFLSFFDVEGRRFGLSADLDVMPLDRLEPIRPSAFSGVPLGDGVNLPLAFVMTKAARLYRGQPGAQLSSSGGLSYRQAVPLTGKRVQAGATGYYETTGGEWLRDEGVVFVSPMRTRPGWVAPGRTWIDVSILKQTLIAYEGEQPVYVTLVSTGVDGLGDPLETHSTVRGQFLIHTKHVTATMSGDEVGDEFDLRDVPYVMYFNEGYALHAAYWHDAFGKPRSHGCVNLSPEDARWIFEWSEPQVPEAWHGALSLRDGTLVHIHP